MKTREDDFAGPKTISELLLDISKLQVENSQLDQQNKELRGELNKTAELYEAVVKYCNKYLHGGMSEMRLKY